jgi:hypothetical protein
MNKKGGAEQQTWVEFMQALFLIICLAIFVPLAISMCSQLKQTSIQDRNVDTFNILAGYLDQLPVSETATKFPLKFDSQYLIQVLRRCTSANQVRGVECSVAPRICLVDTDNKNIAPFCHELKGEKNEVVDFSVTQDRLTGRQGLRLIKRGIEQGKNPAATYTEITIGTAGAAP